MATDMRSINQSPRLFRNGLLETLSRTPVYVVPAVYVPIVTYLVWYSVARKGTDVTTTFLLLAGGAFAWTLAEYWIHRAIMHWIPKFSWGERMHFWVHGIHHDWPNDPFRLVMPPSVSLVLFVIFLAIFRILFGKMCWAFLAGFTLGYIVYDVTHYLVHHTKPKKGLLRSLQKHHLSHHFQPRYENLRFSITTPMWDRVFGTREVPENRAEEPTGVKPTGS
jgi:sterol desaturase/sphingolipid hydroxylase (fatty acid hydroxylase superfamily)